MKSYSNRLLASLAAVAAVIGGAACGDPAGPGAGQQQVGDGNDIGGAVFLVIDEESIDNGTPPNHFSAVDVNDDLAQVGLRLPLPFFQAHEGEIVDLFTGEVGDEGWHALTAIPRRGLAPAPPTTARPTSCSPDLGWAPPGRTTTRRSSSTRSPG